MIAEVKNFSSGPQILLKVVNSMLIFDAKSRKLHFPIVLLLFIKYFVVLHFCCFPLCVEI
jgi:hypothetical protein